jgi:hypothetical protein
MESHLKTRAALFDVVRFDEEAVVATANTCAPFRASAIPLHTLLLALPDA